VPITANIFHILSGPDVAISSTNGVTYITSSAPNGNPLLRTIENISSGVCIKLYNSEGDYDHMWDGYNSRYHTNDFIYWSDNQSSRLHGSLKLRYGDDTPWEYHFCDDRGRRVLSAGPLNGSAHSAAMEIRNDIDTIQDLKNIAGLSCTAELNSYTPLDGTGDTRNSKDSRKPRKTEKYIIENGNAILTAREWHIYRRGSNEEHLTLEHIAIRAASQSSAINDAANQTTITVSISDHLANALILRGRPLSQQNPDGTKTTWIYDLNEPELSITIYSGTAASPEGMVGKSTYEVELLDANYGHTKERSTRLHTGNPAADPILSWELNEYETAIGNLMTTYYSDGTFTSNVWDCCRITHTIARDGSISEYYDISGQPSWSASGQTTQGLLPGADGLFTVQESYTDALGRETSNVRSVRNAAFEQSGAYAPQTTTITYPFGTDNFSVTTDPLGICTTNITTWNGGKNITITSRAGITTTTASIAGGVNITTTEWTDSVSGEQLKKMTKTEFDIQANGWEKTTAYVKYGDGEWLAQSETVSDLLGRTAISSRAGTGGAMLMTSNVYNNAGQNVQTISHDGATTVFDYNELGGRTATISVAAGQTLDFNPQSFTLDDVIALDKYVINLTTESLAQHSRNQFFATETLRGTEGALGYFLGRKIEG